jgi:hypothetical protein
MPIVLGRDDRRTRLTAVASGELTLDELLTFVKSERTGELERYTLLFDLSAAAMNLTRNQIAAVADQVQSLTVRTGPRAAVAIVAPSDLLFGLTRMYQTLCDSAGVDTVRVFRDLPSAELWLDTQPAGAVH